MKFIIENSIFRGQTIYQVQLFLIFFVFSLVSKKEFAWIYLLQTFITLLNGVYFMTSLSIWNSIEIIFQHQNTQLRNASQYTREKLSDRQANREEVTTFLTNRFRVKYFKLFYDLLTFYNEHIKWSLFQCIQKLHILQLNYKIAQHTYIFMSKFSWNIYQ